MLTEQLKNVQYITNDYLTLLDLVDGVYIVNYPNEHDNLAKIALDNGKHVLVETPMSTSVNSCLSNFNLAHERNCVYMEAIKTAYSLAFERLLLLLKTGIIGDVVSIDATCTSLKKVAAIADNGTRQWGSLYAWGSFALLPIFMIFGCNYKEKSIQTKMLDDTYDLFTKIDFIYSHGVASIKVGNGVKSEGELIISGTKGYIFVPAPWWKTDYYEVRFENPQENKRYFYQLEGEGIRYMILSFVRAIAGEKANNKVPESISLEISRIMDDFYNLRDVKIL